MSEIYIEYNDNARSSRFIPGTGEQIKSGNMFQNESFKKDILLCSFGKFRSFSFRGFHSWVKNLMDYEKMCIYYTNYNFDFYVHLKMCLVCFVVKPTYDAHQLLFVLVIAFQLSLLAEYYFWALRREDRLSYYLREIVHYGLGLGQLDPTQHDEILLSVDEIYSLGYLSRNSEVVLNKIRSLSTSYFNIPFIPNQFFKKQENQKKKEKINEKQKKKENDEKPKKKNNASLDALNIEGSRDHLVGIETNPGPLFDFGLNHTLDSDVADIAASLCSSIDVLSKTIKEGVDVNVKSPLVTEAIQKVTEGYEDSKFTIALVISRVVLYAIKRQSDSSIVKAVDVLVTALSCYKAWSDPTVLTLLNAVVNILDTVPMSEGTTGDFEPQFDVSSLLEALPKAVMGLMYYLIYRRTPSEEFTFKFIKACGDFPKLKAGVENIIDTVIHVLEIVVNFIARHAGFDEICLKRSLFPEIERVAEKIGDLTSELRSGQPYNHARGSKLIQYAQELNTILSRIPNTKDFSEYKKECIRILSEIKPFISKFERSNISGNGPRAAPLAIMLAGASGVGKSTAAYPLMLAIMGKTLDDSELDQFVENHNDFIYSYFPDQDFMNGYHGQFTVMYDEAGAVRDSVGSPDAGALALLRMVNIANFLTDQAHLEDKGAVNFRSKLILGTTNRRTFEFNSLYNNEAFIRRISLPLFCCPAAKYCTDDTMKCGDLWDRRLDVSKIPPVDGEKFNLGVMEYRYYDFVKGEAYGPVMSFDDVVDLASSKMTTTIRHGEDMLDFHNIMKQRVVQARKRNFQPQSGMAEMAAEMVGCDIAIAAEVIECYGPGSLSDFGSSYGQYVADKLEVARQRLVGLSSHFSPKTIAFAIMSVAVASMIWRFLKRDMSPQSVTVKSRKDVQKLRTARRSALKPMSAQAGIPPNVVDVANSIFKKNTYSIQRKGNSKRLGYATFLFGRTAFIPAHFVYYFDGLFRDELDEDSILVFRRVGSPKAGFECSYHDMDFVQYDEDDNDCAFVTFPPGTCHDHANITKFIAEDGIVSDRNRFDGCIVVPVNDVVTMMSCKMWYVGSMTYGDYQTTQSIQYNLPTKWGDCGSLIMLCEKGSSMPKILGFHVAGDSSSGIATLLNRATCLDLALISDAGIKYDVGEVSSMVPQIGEQFLVTQMAEPYPCPIKTNICPSALQKTPLVKYRKSKPAMLAPVDDIDPWALSRNKYSRISSHFNGLVLDAVTLEYSKLFNRDLDEHGTPRTMTYEESVAGIAGDQYFNGIPRGTSAGYPFFLTMTKKYDLFGKDGEYDFTSPASASFREHIEKLDSQVRAGNRLNVVFTDFLKDELLPEEKVTQGKARLISAAPVDYLVLSRKYFGDFVRYFMRFRIRNGSAVGINPYGHEWTTLSRYLTSVTGGKDSPNFIFGDYKGYDGSLCPRIEYAFLTIVENFYMASPGYDPADAVARAALFEDVVNSRHICHDPFSRASIIYEWFGSNPSGNFLTTPMNTICNILLLSYASCVRVLKVNDIALVVKNVGLIFDMCHDVMSNLRIIAYGDDNGMGVSDVYKHIISQKSLTEELAVIGFTYTNEAKDDTNDITHRRLSECDFLKRSFLFVPETGMYRAPLNIGTVRELPLWRKRTMTDMEYELVCDTFFMELALHEPGVWQAHAKEFADEMRMVNGYVPNMSRDYWLAKAEQFDAFY